MYFLDRYLKTTSKSTVDVMMLYLRLAISYLSQVYGAIWSRAGVIRSDSVHVRHSSAPSSFIKRNTELDEIKTKTNRLMAKAY